MKKQYIRYGIIFCGLVLLAFMVVFVIYTRNKINEFNSNFNLSFISVNIDYHDNNIDGQLEHLLHALPS